MVVSAGREIVNEILYKLFYVSYMQCWFPLKEGIEIVHQVD